MARFKCLILGYWVECSTTVLPQLALSSKGLFTFARLSRKNAGDRDSGRTYYHIVILLLNIRIKQIELTNSDPPLKIPRPFGTKTTRPNSTLEMAPPPLFPDLVSQSGLNHTLYYLRMFLTVNKLLRNLISLRQHVSLLYYLGFFG
jgi:hypothetical protein